MSNTAINTYLNGLRGKIFKLLPMKEAYDNGEDNHLYEYVDNLQSGCVGALALYPELNNQKIMLDIITNIAYIATAKDISLKRWRSIILRSTRLVSSLINDYGEED